MNKTKLKILRIQAKLTRRVASEIKPLRRDLDDAQRFEINKRHIGHKLPSTYAAVQLVLTLSKHKQARIGRALICNNSEYWGGSNNVLIEGYFYEEKIILLSAVDCSWFLNHQFAFSGVTNRTLAFFHKS